jgi:glycopeptide antibiotics resistance protein
MNRQLPEFLNVVQLVTLIFTRWSGERVHYWLPMRCGVITIRRALLLLFMWTVFVELAQPWFTQLRSRQASDLIGNCVGVLFVFVAAEIIAKVRARR